MKLNELLCPDCENRMFVVFDENDDYASHGCGECQFFHKLGNFEEYER